MKTFKGQKIVIWGAGKRGERIFNIISSLGILVHAFGDIDINKHNKEILGIPCYSKEEIIELEKDGNLTVISSPADPRVYQELKNEFRTVISGRNYLMFEKVIGIKGMEDLFPIGHYYSLYPNLDELRLRLNKIFNENREILDLDLNESNQLRLFEQMGAMFASLPDWETSEGGGYDTNTKIRLFRLLTLWYGIAY